MGEGSRRRKRRTRRRRDVELRLAFLFALMCSLAGCGSFQAYSGAARQQRDIAIVSIDYMQAFWLLGGASLTFRSLDGVSIPLSNSDGGLITEVQLEPGEHDIAFDYKACMYGAYAMNLCGPVKSETLRFTALKGHRYHLNVDTRDDRLWGWIIDVESDQIVAGASPP